MPTSESLCQLGILILLGVGLSREALPQSFDIESQPDGALQTISKEFRLMSTPESVGNGRFVWWRTDISRPGTNFLRLRFSDIHLGESNFDIRITDREGAELENIPGASLKGRETYWSGILLGSHASVAVLAASTPDLTFHIDTVAYQQNRGGPLSITGSDDREHVVNYKNNPSIWAAQKAVGRLSIIDAAGLKVCTGFMVSESVLVTNDHCVADQATCETTDVLFGFRYDEQGNLHHGLQARCEALLAASYKFDYALLKLRGAPGGNKEIGMLSFSGEEPEAGQHIIIIQHPAGQPKQISKKGCDVVEPIVDGRATGSDTSHVCDTLGGSSGSPVLDLNGKVVGLHHFGFAEGPFWDKNRAIRGSIVKEAVDGL